MSDLDRVLLRNARCPSPIGHPGAGRIPIRFCMAARLDVGFERLFNSIVDDVNVAFNPLNSFELHSKQEAVVVLELTSQGEC